MTEAAKPKRDRKFARTLNLRVSAGTVSQEATSPRELVGPPGAPAVKPESKIARVVSLLQRPEGASLEELVTATGWQQHTTRAALTGIKKKGHSIAKDKVDGVTRYSIAAEARS